MKTAKKLLAVVLCLAMLTATIIVNYTVSAEEQPEYVTVLNQDFEGDGIAEYYSKAENGYHDDYRTVGIVTGEGIGNNGSNTAIKIGFGRDFTSNAERGNKPAFNVSSTMEYNGRNVGESFRFKPGLTYKLGFYYKVVSCNSSGQFQLWANQIQGSLDTTTVDLLDAKAYLKLVNNFNSTTSDYVYVETEITAKDESGYDLVFMLRQIDNNVVGTTIYIDDITVKAMEETGGEEEEEIIPLPEGTVLSATFEDNGTDGKDTIYYGSEMYSNGISPQPSNNIPNDPRETCLVTGEGVGYDGSTGAIKFGYKNDPDDTNKAGHPVFSVRTSHDYNNRSDTESFRLIANNYYTLSFYYKAENINTPVDLYMREYDNTLHGARLDTNDSTRPSVKLASVTAATDGWVKVEQVVKGAKGQNMLFLMKPTAYSSLAGTAVYIDNITVEEVKPFVSGEVTQTFEVATDMSGFNTYEDWEISTEKNHTESGSKSAKITIERGDNTAAGRPRMILNFEGKNLLVKKGDNYRVSFWIYSSEEISVFNYYIYSSASPDLTDKLEGQKEIEKYVSLSQGWNEIIADITVKGLDSSEYNYLQIGLTNSAATGEDYGSKVEYFYVDDISLKVITKPSKPSVPVIESYTADSVTLEVLANGEYSLDGTNWQDSNVFEGLTPWTTYKFYQRIKATETSANSDAVATDFLLVLHGDLNMDSEINTQDLVLLRQLLLGLEVECNEIAMNVNSDEGIDIRDLVALKKKCVNASYDDAIVSIG